jgi:hypothetical protein
MPIPRRAAPRTSPIPPGDASSLRRLRRVMHPHQLECGGSDGPAAGQRDGPVPSWTPAARIHML